MHLRHPLPLGTEIDAKYRIAKVIGAGGMGYVYQAEHILLRERVALKMLLNWQDAREVERFLREARAAFSLRSPHIARTLDVGTHSGAPYLVMELLRGLTLADYVEASEKGRLDEGEASAIALQCCAGLEEAHKQGIIHRDIKPANVFLEKTKGSKVVAKILDFGISKTTTESSLTLPHELLGSPNFMAPEQWAAGGGVDQRTDVFALGVVLYFMLTGTVPLLGVPFAEQRKRLLAGAFAPPGAVVPTISDAMNRVVMKALRPRPDERYDSTAEFAESLQEVAGPGPASSSEPTLLRPSAEGEEGSEEARNTEEPMPATVLAPLTAPNTPNRKDAPAIAPHASKQAPLRAAQQPHRPTLKSLAEGFEVTEKPVPGGNAPAEFAFDETLPLDVSEQSSSGTLPLAAALRPAVPSPSSITPPSKPTAGRKRARREFPFALVVFLVLTLGVLLGGGVVLVLRR